MPVFAVILDRDSPDAARVIERLQDCNPIQIGPAAYLVRSDTALTSEIAEKGGIKGDNRLDVLGVVLGLDGARSGYHRADVWEWVRRWVDQ